MPIKNNIYDYETNKDKFYGIYRGVVECRYDPEKLCRCKIRVWGVHDELKEKTDKRGVPTKELPWAEPAFGLYQGSISGNGIWTVPLQGSYVWVFFENGNWMAPRYFATVPGMPIEPANPAEGFNDPMGEFPRADWTEEPDTHRLMKRDKLGETTLLTTKLPNIDLGVGIAMGGSWDEHPPMYQAEYPFNTVMYSHSGIYTEIDDTEGNRRYHVYHPSNSYIEIGEIGQMTIRNAEKRWDICDDMKFEHVMNDYHRKVDTNRTTLVGLDQWEEVMLNRYSKIHINDRKDVIGDQIYHVFSSQELHVDLNRTVYTGISSKDWVNLTKDRFIGLFDNKIVGVEQKTFVGILRTDITGFYDTEYTGVEKDIRAGDVIHIQAGSEIILDAPVIRIKGAKFLDHAEETEIAGEFKWNAEAEGKAKWAGDADTAVSIGGPGSDEIAVASEANEAPERPDLPIVIPPIDPAAIPAPPAPPAPPVLEYIDEPPEDDPCPPEDCPEKESVIL